jgi:pinin/SDK/memA/ protein conserved region
MISSAVVIPKQPTLTEEPSPPSLKRRQSSQSIEISKRPRLDLNNGNGSHDSALPPSAMSPPRRKSSLLTGTEEKKRGQRLFGRLLGTLSQTSTKPAHKKRDEIEKRQQERVRRDNEEREEERKRKKEELLRVRRAEQKVWDRESEKLRQRNARAMAGFLRTKTEPRLYYKPWELRPEEEEQIKKQIEEFAEASRKEQSEDQPRITTSPLESDSKEAKEEEPPVKTEDSGMQNGTDPDCNTNEELKTEDAQEDGEENDGPNAEPKQESNAPMPKTEPDSKAVTEDKSKDDDNGGEELVEGHEDDVIY